MTEIQDIINTRERLDKELRLALATMEHKERVLEIRKQIKENQERCPHYSAQFNWTCVDGCPYCGKKYSTEGSV